MAADAQPPPDLGQRAANILNITMFAGLGVVVLALAAWTAIGAYQPFVTAWTALPYPTQVDLRRFPEALFWMVVGLAWTWRASRSLRQRWRRS